jgi:predicted RNA-binding protein with PUA-like domain
VPAYWILKTEPGTYSLDDLKRERRTRWDGVTNPVALKHLRSMRAGDQAFIYHTGDEKAIVGLARVASDGYPDPANPKLAMVDLEFRQPVVAPVSLAAIKADPAFQDLALVRQGRLSVVPVPESLWRRLLAMAKTVPS